MSVKQRIISAIIKREGGFVDDPDDSGGATRYGITEAVARDYGYTGQMRDLPRSVAESVYSDRYWDAVRGDELLDLSEQVAEEVVDTAVNMGPGRAGEFLQRALSVLTPERLTVDGAIGPVTIATLAEYLSDRSEIVLARALNCLQGAYYIDLAERRPKDKRFVYGWLRERVTL